MGMDCLVCHFQWMIRCSPFALWDKWMYGERERMGRALLIRPYYQFLPKHFHIKVERTVFCKAKVFMEHMFQIAIENYWVSSASEVYSLGRADSSNLFMRCYEELLTIIKKAFLLENPEEIAGTKLLVTDRRRIHCIKYSTLYKDIKKYIVIEYESN